jgi:uncharacterized membrane protein (UPF0127 family)
MEMVNITRSTHLAWDLQVAHGPWQRCQGLIGRDDFRDGQGLLIPRCRSIHTFFMKFPIDVIVLEENLIVAKVKKELEPYRLLIGPISGRYVLELPTGTILRSKTQEGDVLSIIE